MSGCPVCSSPIRAYLDSAIRERVTAIDARSPSLETLRNRAGVGEGDWQQHITQHLRLDLPVER
jgi:hypothetical protein